MNPLIRKAGRWAKRAQLRALRRLSSQKARYNTLLNQREIWHGRARLDSFPREIQVGTNWTCNLRCYFCRRQSVEAERLASLQPSQREIPQAALDKLMAVLPYAEVFNLTPLGEPLLYSGLDRLLERCRAVRPRNLQLTTNGNAMTEARARQLVEAGVRRIFFSIDSADPTTYAEMRVGGTLDKASEGLAHLNEWKARLGADIPEIVIASTFMRRNITDLPGLVEFARANQASLLSVQLMEAEDPSLEPETLGRHIPLTVDWLRQARRKARELGVNLAVHPALRNLLAAHAGEPGVAELLAEEPALDTRGQTLMDKCLYPWTFLVVDTDGDARPCCWAALSYGNLAERSFDEIWNGEAAQRMRRDFLSNLISPYCQGKHCRVDL